jgi:hypothetical protein
MLKSWIVLRTFAHILFQSFFNHIKERGIIMFVHWIFACFLMLGFNTSMGMEITSEEAPRNQIKNYCGYHIGQCYCIYTCGHSPDADNHAWEEASLSTAGCCAISNLATNGASFLYALIRSNCILSDFLPLIVTSSMTGLCALHACCGVLIYGSAQSMGKREFIESFDRGLRYELGDPCVCTAFTKHGCKQCHAELNKGCAACLMAMGKIFVPCCGESE